MKIDGNTVLITGGASGIGLALAERFIKAGNEVIVCGRREVKLQEAKARFPELHTRVCDITDPLQRQALCQWVRSRFPRLNVLVNNAGIQQRVDLLAADADWRYYQQEVAANLEAPIHLCLLLLPHMQSQPSAAIINVSSGLALTPGAWVPVYSATKAALHSFTMSLRLQLAGTGISVVEVLPPAVNTDLGGAGLHTFGEPLEAFADAVFDRFRGDDTEIGYGDSEKRLRASKIELEAMAGKMWERMKSKQS